MTERHDVASRVQNPGAGEDDLLGVISDVEKQLSALKNFHVERDETKQRLEQREAALMIRQQELESLQAEIRAQRSDLDQRRQALEQAESSMHQVRQQLERDQHEAVALREQAQEERQRFKTEFEHQAQTLADREQRVSDAATALSRQREELEQVAASLAQRELAAREAAQQSEQLRHELEQLRDSISHAQSLASSQQSDAETLRQQSQKLMADLVAARGEAQELQSRLQQADAASADLQSQLASRQEAIAAAEQRAQTAVDELQKHRDASQKQHGEIEALTASIAERDARIQDLEQKLAATTEALELAVERIAAKSETPDHPADFQELLALREERIASLESELAQSRADSAAAGEKLRAFAQSAKQQSDASDQTHRLERELAAAAQRLAALEQELVQARSEAAAAQQRMAANKAGESADSSALQAKLTQLMDRVEELEEALQVAHVEMKKAFAENQALRDRLASPSAGPAAQGVPADVGEAIDRRWARLRLMRSLLRDQTEKLNKAGEVLRVRYQECEEILKERESLSKTQASLNEARRNLEKLQSGSAKNRSFSLIFYAIATIGLLAGISYAIASQIAPATYAVRAVIAADIPPQGASDDQLAEWLRHHEALLHDPRVLDGAAERMGRRGIISLSKPADLDAYLNESMTSVSGAPGQLTLELKGRGGAHLTRVLDTYIAALASTGNAGKARRADGLGTTVLEAANTGAGPISDLRLLYAIVIFAGGLGLAYAFVMGFGKRLTIAKQRFEKEQMVEANQSEASWRQAAEIIGRD